ncbi:MAG: glycosyltransferase [Chloroflexota bacterium]
MKSNHLRLLLVAGDEVAPASRYRIHQFVPYLRARGHQVSTFSPFPAYYWHPPKVSLRALRWGLYYLGSTLRVLSCLPAIQSAGRYDVVMMNRSFVPEHWILALERRLQRVNPRLVFDFDDAIHLGINEKKIAEIIQRSAWVTPGNQFLADFAQQHNSNVTVIPTVVDTDKFVPAGERAPGPVRVGWSGSRDSTLHHLPLLKDILVELARRVEFEFVVISDLQPPEIPGVKSRFIPWSAQSEAYDHQQIDIGLMPLGDSPFDRGKCGAKLLLYGAVGAPSVASPVGANREIIQQEQTGCLAGESQEWVDALERLIRNPALRRQLGDAARQRIEAAYSVRAILPRLEAIFEQVTDLHPRN